MDASNRYTETAHDHSSLEIRSVYVATLRSGAAGTHDEKLGAR